MRRLSDDARRDPRLTAYSQALKALALVRSQKVEESLVLCDEILASKPTDDGVLSAMMHVLRGLGRRKCGYHVCRNSFLMFAS